MCNQQISIYSVLQEEHDELQDKFEEEMSALEKKYHELQGAPLRAA